MSCRKAARRPRPLLLLATLVVLLAGVVATSSPVLAQSSTREPSEEPSAVRGPGESRGVETLVGKVLARQLEEYGIPGATVSVVKDGKVLFVKGYGLADVETKEPVAADETLFKIASVSKLFTATAVMQLAEEGRLDLDRNVNAYLGDVEVPDTYPGRPVTLRHLLTHTAGFEERFTGSGARNAAGLGLGEYLSEEMPARVRPPGEVMAYSNYGMALAGYVVQEVSGVPFERYVEENVTGPLGMESTTFTQPPPPELRKSLAPGYDVEEGVPVAGEFLGYPRDAPASAATTTATDMAAFMIAHLQAGRYENTRILQEATAKEMHARQFTNDPRLDGMALGFEEQTLNGERVLEHGGGGLQHHALLALLPERDVGVFVAYDSYGKGGDWAEYELVDAFIDRFYPDPDLVAEPPGGETFGDAQRVAGSYRPTRSNLTGFEKFMTLPNSARVTANDDGSITTSGVPSRKDLDGGEQRWIEDGPLLFRAEGDDEHLAFRQDAQGRITYLTGEASPPNVAYEKLPFYEAPRLHLGVLAVGLAVFLLTAVGWPVGAVVSRLHGRWRGKRYGKPGAHSKPQTGNARRARILAWSVSVLNVVFVAGMVMVISSVTATAYGVSPLLISVLALPLVGAVLTVGVFVEAALAWRRGYWGLLGRLHRSLVALSALTFAAVLAYYNLSVFGL